MESATFDILGSKRNPGGHASASSMARVVLMLQVRREVGAFGSRARWPTMAGLTPAFFASARPLSLWNAMYSSSAA